MFDARETKCCLSEGSARVTSTRNRRRKTGGSFQLSPVDVTGAHGAARGSANQGPDCGGKIHRADGGGMGRVSG